jgi:hypothetical protein
MGLVMKSLLPGNIDQRLRFERQPTAGRMNGQASVIADERLIEDAARVAVVWRPSRYWEGIMRKLIGLVLVLTMVGCSVCKSSDSPEVCRTKQRDHSQPRTEFSAAIVGLAR